MTTLEFPVLKSQGALGGIFLLFSAFYLETVRPHFQSSFHYVLGTGLIRPGPIQAVIAVLELCEGEYDSVTAP
jgi:hypothetical protein